MAEGLVLDLDPHDLAEVESAERDEHGHVRIAEVDLGHVLKEAVQARLAGLGLKATIVAKDIGYELRCADPIPYDLEYTRDLGYCATKYLIEGGTAAMVSTQAGRFVAVPFSTMIDPETGRTRVRLVDIHSTRYAIARRYMIRLRRDDFQHPELIAKYAAAAKLPVEEFRRQFEYLIADEPPALVLGGGSGAASGAGTPQ
jgi:6-phosphofructokinase 1